MFSPWRESRRCSAIMASKPRRSSQLADHNQADVGGDAGSLKRDLQKPVECELKGLGFFLTRRVSPSVARFPASEPRKVRLDACSAGQGTTTKSEIRGSVLSVTRRMWIPAVAILGSDASIASCESRARRRFVAPQNDLS